MDERGLSEIEERNWRQIEDLNQRGGRMLSVVDLLLAGTVDLDLAAYVCWQMSRGVSIITAANPGGAGKTTVMAAFLGFITPGTKIITVSESSILDPANSIHKKPECLLVHEIGAGHYYGYIWGRDVLRYFKMIEPGRSIVSNLHADTLDELKYVLNNELHVPNDLLGKVDLIMFIAMHRGRSYFDVKRRVSTVYQSFNGKHELIFQHELTVDKFTCHKPEVLEDAHIKQLRSFLEELLKKRQFEYMTVRKLFLEFYKRWC
ncbi:MAG: hypothetical protein N2487_05415 [Verrucomicrobiae bacterium]|nr:hypothetical protein [Verrucomicrobiae bacterium]